MSESIILVPPSKKVAELNLKVSAALENIREVLGALQVGQRVSRDRATTSLMLLNQLTGQFPFDKEPGLLQLLVSYAVEASLKAANSNYQIADEVWPELLTGNGRSLRRKE